MTWLCRAKGRPAGRPYCSLACSQANSNTLSVIQRLKPSLSMNCLKSSVSSFMTFVMTRSSALSCSMRELAASEFCRAFLKAASAATRDGMVLVMSSPTRSASSQTMSPKRSLKVLRMFESRSSSGSVRWPPPAVGTGSTLGVLVWQQDLLHRLLLDPVAV